MHHASAFVANRAFWNKLTEEQRKVIMDAVPDTPRMRKEVDDSVKPKMEEFKKNGGFIHELTSAQREEWAKLVRPRQQEMLANAGPDAQELWDAIQKGKKAFAERGGK